MPGFCYFVSYSSQRGSNSIESGEEADGGNNEEGIASMQEDGVGDNDVARGVATTECDEAEMLLEEAESMILQK